MPLASIVQVPFIWLLGPTGFASALPFALLGSTAAPLTWAIARDAGARTLVAVGAGILIAIPGLMTIFVSQPDKDRKSTRLNSSHLGISYAVFCLKKKRN